VKLSDITKRKFIKSFNIADYQVETPSGYEDITQIHKTIKYKEYKIELETSSLICADTHILMDKDNNEVYAKDSLGCLIQTKTGFERVLRVQKLKTSSNMYDISLGSKESLGSQGTKNCYYTNDILSHNTITVGSYLLWRGNFHPQPLNIGIVANKPRTAREVLTKIKQIFLMLPIWMMQCVGVWNKSDITLANTGTRFLTDSPSADSFRGDTISLLFCDEVGFINKQLWEEMLDSIIPTMSSLSFKQLIYTSTSNGKNHWANIVELAKQNLNDMTLIQNDWREVPHFDKGGNPIPPDLYKETIIKRFGKKFFAQTEENEFLGSSDTLVGADTLRLIEDRTQKQTSKEKILYGLNVYKDVEPENFYIVCVDPAKDGIDFFSINVVNISRFPFEQVAYANIQCDYISMPEQLNELGLWYNNALIIIENNEGAGQSITDTLFNVYEYENLYRDKNIDGKVGFKKYTGFRTTVKSRSLILNLLRLFLEEGKLLINSDLTLKQLYTFTKDSSGKYVAESGYFDDAVMSLALVFAPFMENRRFDDYKLFVQELKIENSEVKTKEFLSLLDIGGQDDGSTDYEEQARLREFREQIFDSINSDYSLDSLDSLDS